MRRGGGKVCSALRNERAVRFSGSPVSRTNGLLTPTVWSGLSDCLVCLVELLFFYDHELQHGCEDCCVRPAASYAAIIAPPFRDHKNQNAELLCSSASVKS